MEHLLVCQLLGESWTVFQGYRPWNICSISLYNTYPVFVVIIQLGILIVFVDQRQRRPHLGTQGIPTRTLTSSSAGHTWEHKVSLHVL